MIHRISFAAVGALLAAAPLYAVTYTFEPEHTQGVVRWNHLGFANPTAQFNNVQGTLEFDRADPTRSSVMVTIPLASMSTGVPDLNEDFQSSDFFDIARFPTATFTSRKVEKGAVPDTLKVVGDLSLHGITKPVALDVTINKIGTNPRNQVAHCRLRSDGHAQALGIRLRPLCAPGRRRDSHTHYRRSGREKCL